jgi:phage baseplate assembly protein W
MNFHGSMLSHPLRADERGALVIVSSPVDLIEQSIVSILETRQGERVMLPDYGLPDVVFEVQDAGFAARLAFYIQQQVLRYEPLVAEVNAVVGSLNPEGAFDRSLAGRVAVNITWTERGANTPRNLLYPLWEFAD